MTEQVKMAKGYLWNDTAEYLEEQRIHQEWAYDFNQTRPSETAKREELLRKIFGQVGKNVFVRPPVTIARGSLVSIGDETYINSNLTIVDDYKITIGKNCLFAPNVTMSTTGHPVHPALRAKGMYSAPITICDNVWIGAGAIILPGVTIGENTVIGAGSVVTRDIPANVIAVGTPCKVLRKITDRDREYYFRDCSVSELPE